MSANPTGPLHVGHGRGAALGDSLALILSHILGYAVTREYYINDDAGNPSEASGRSRSWPAMLELEGKPFTMPEQGLIKATMSKTLKAQEFIWRKAGRASATLEQAIAFLPLKRMQKKCTSKTTCPRSACVV